VRTQEYLSKNGLLDVSDFNRIMSASSQTGSVPQNTSYVARIPQTAASTRLANAEEVFAAIDHVCTFVAILGYRCEILIQLDNTLAKWHPDVQCVHAHVICFMSRDWRYWFQAYAAMGLS